MFRKTPQETVPAEAGAGLGDHGLPSPLTAPAADGEPAAAQHEHALAQD